MGFNFKGREMKMIKGYSGQILRVDLSKSEIKKQPLDPVFAKKFLGGRGFGAKTIFDELEPRTDPLNPKNLLIFATGPFTGTTLKGCKYSVVTKSPLTGTYMDSEAGGHFGPELKFASYDMVVISGSCKKLAYLWIDDDHVELRNAEHLRGKGVLKTDEMVKKDVGDRSVKVAAIGPAGENLVRFACISNDLFRHAGRGGVGAVMGSKRLKAIVVRGSKDVKIAEPDALMNLMESELKQTLKHATAKSLHNGGTLVYLPMYLDWGVLPIQNFRSGYFESGAKLTADVAKKELSWKSRACFMCPIACGKLSFVKDGPYAGTIVEGPEYETTCLLGSNCGVDDLKTIARANLLCDDLGLDSISTGNVISFAMECYERGLLTKGQTDLKLNFGNKEAVLELVKKIAEREGIGNFLAEGVRRAAISIGGEAGNFAMHVKGLELPGYEPRSTAGMALAFAISDIGGSHCRSWPIGEEMSRSQERFDVDGKAGIVMKSTLMRTLPDILGFCRFIVLDFEDYARTLSALTGWRISGGQLREVVERVYVLTRAFNVREGFRRKDDTLPIRIFNDGIETGPIKGRKMDKGDLEKMLDDYYEIWGWDEEGVPTLETFKKYGLEEIGKKLTEANIA